MFRVVLAACIAVLGVFSTSGVYAQTGGVCGEAQEYFETLDELMFDGMMVYFTEPGWFADYQATEDLVDDANEVAGKVTQDDVQPLLDILMVPGEVLSDFPEADVPEIVQTLHETSLAYWDTMPDFMTAYMTEGVSAGLEYYDAIETSTEDNFAAMEELEQECPDLVENMVDAAEGADMSSILDDEAGIDQENIDSADAPDGFGFDIITTPAQEFAEN